MSDALAPFQPVPAQTTPLIRTARASLTILEGQDVLLEGSELVRRLWNKARFWQRRYYDEHHSFAGWTKLQRELRRQGLTYGLGDRCFSYTLRRFNANLLIWVHNRFQQPALRPPGYAYRPQPLLFEVGRNAKPVGPWTYRLTVLGEDQPDRHALIKLHLRPGVKMAQVKMIQVQPTLTAVVTYQGLITSLSAGPGLAGIDLGIVNLAAVAFQSGECFLYSGQALRDLERSARRQTQKVQKKAPRYQAVWTRVRHIRRLALHHLTNSILQECLARQVGTIVIGNLKHIRQDKRHHAVRMWAYARIVEQLRYKGLEHGLQVIQVDEHYTSRRCHWCDGPGQRTHGQRQFHCSVCGRQIDADVGASFKILTKRALLPTYAWGIPPDLQRRYELPVIGPTHRAEFTKAFTLHFIPVNRVSPLDPPSFVKGPLTGPAGPGLGKPGNRLLSSS